MLHIYRPLANFEKNKKKRQQENENSSVDLRLYKGNSLSDLFLISITALLTECILFLNGYIYKATVFTNWLSAWALESVLRLLPL